MRLLLALSLFGVIMMITAFPAAPEEYKIDDAPAEEPTSLLDVVDVGAVHANDGDRNARHWGYGGWGGGFGGFGGGWGGGYGGGWGRGYGHGYGGYGHGWGGYGRRWGGGGWGYGGGYWG